MTYPWTIPDAMNLTGQPCPDNGYKCNQMKIKVTPVDYSDVVDYSENPFYITPRFIINRPSPGDTFTVDDYENISWTTYGTIDKVMLYYSNNSGGDWYPITTSAYDNGSGPAETLNSYRLCYHYTLTGK